MKRSKIKIEIGKIRKSQGLFLGSFAIYWEQRKLGEVAQSFEYGLNAAAKEYDGINKYLE